MDAIARFWDSDVAYSFRHSQVAIIAAIVAFVLIFSAVFAVWVAPHNPFDLATLNLLDASLPPSWEQGGDPRFWLGTDDQGRDVFSAIMFGMQVSLLIGLVSVALSVVLGVSLGLLSGYVGGKLDAFIMRICDVMLSFPAILVALLIDGVARAALPRDAHNEVALRRADHRARLVRVGAVLAHRARVDAGREEQGVSEVLYDPASGPEYIELHNNTASTVALFDPANPANRWKLGGGIDYTFPPNQSLAAGGCVLVVDFDPDDAVALGAFRAQYGIDPAVAVFGSFAGNLANEGESVEVYRPGKPQQPPSPEARICSVRDSRLGEL